MKDFPFPYIYLGIPYIYLLIKYAEMFLLVNVLVKLYFLIL